MRFEMHCEAVSSKRWKKKAADLAQEPALPMAAGDRGDRQGAITERESGRKRNNILQYGPIRQLELQICILLQIWRDLMGHKPIFEPNLRED